MTMVRIPVWQRVYDDLRAQIVSGQLGVGLRLPSDTELAQRYQLNHITVRKGVARLVQEGLIERRVGAGSFVRDPAAKPAGLRSVALVVQDMLTSSAVPHALLGCAMRGLRETLSQERYHIELLSYRSHHFAALEPLLTPTRVGGAVIVGGIADNDRHAIVRRLRAKGLALVVANSRFELDCPVVSLDRADLLRQAVEGALRAGHRAIGLMIYASDDCAVLQAAFAAALAAGGGDPALGRVLLVPDRDHPDLAPALPDWRGGDTPPSCLIVGDETLARAALRSAGPAVRLGRELSLIAMVDNTPGALLQSLCAPDTGALQTRLFVEAGRQLAACLDQPDAGGRRMTLVRGTLILGESLGAPPAVAQP